MLLSMKTLITGGAGFIGSNLADYFISKDLEITILDDFSNSSEEKIKPLINKGAKLVKADITNYKILENAFDDFDSVIHLAAKIDVQESIKKPELYHKVNVIGTKNLLNACVKKGIKNVIAASSAAVFGTPNNLPLSEDSSLLPESTYGQTKVEMEKILTDFSKNSNLNCISLRFFNVYGKGQTDAYAGVITKFMNKIKENKPLIIFGNGTNTRDFISIEDVMESIFQSLKNIQGKKGNCYNIASGKSTTINELAQMMLEVSGKTMPIKYESPRKGDILHSQANIDLAIRELGFNPKIPLKDGLKKLLET